MFSKRKRKYSGRFFCTTTITISFFVLLTNTVYKYEGDKQE